MNNEPVAYENTDKEIWREIPDDYYAPSIFVTAQNTIGINVGGSVHVKHVHEWHRLAHPIKEHFEDEPQAEELHEIMQSNAELTDSEIQEISHRYHYTYNPGCIGKLAAKKGSRQMNKTYWFWIGFMLGMSLIILMVSSGKIAVAHSCY